MGDTLRKLSADAEIGRVLKDQLAIPNWAYRLPDQPL
jgi:hypothetical protein